MTVAYLWSQLSERMQQPADVAQLEDLLSRPTAGVRETLGALEGDVAILGAGGKMGPTLARMVRRGLDEIGQSERKVFAVSRFSDVKARKELQGSRVTPIPCDLLDRSAVQALPDAPNVIFMAGQKFGTSEAPELTWVMNTLVPANVAERYAKSRMVVFSTGCVYPLVPLSGPGSREEDALDPPGEYAATCVGRERVFAHFAKQHGTKVLFFRLCYANDLRYGVLLDIAQKVANGMPVDVSMGAVHVIWQGDANARAIQCLARVANPPVALNVTGFERVSVRWLAEEFGGLLGKKPTFSGVEGERAWLWDASRSYGWFGPPEVNLKQMIHATAQWIRQGGATINKPTHFEATDGKF
jgi:nucleoside-diphosphate-sugar epimerase